MNILGFAIGFGAVLGIAKGLDKYLRDETRAEWARSVIEGYGAPLKAARVSTFTEMFHDHVLAELFGRRALTWRFFATSAMLSIFFMLSIGLVLFWNDWEGLGNAVDNASKFPVIFVLGVCGTLFVDWISFAQTRYFFELMGRANAFVKVVWLALADIVLTSNIFTFLFAAVLGLIAVVFIYSERTIAMQVQMRPATKGEAPNLAANEYKFLTQFRSPASKSDLQLSTDYFRGGILLKATAKAQGGAPYSLFDIYSNVDEPEPGLIVRSIAALVGGHVVEGEPRTDGGITLWPREAIDFEVTKRGARYVPNAWWTYATGFTVANIVRDGFVGPILDGRLSVNLGEYFSTLAASYWAGDAFYGQPSVLCLDGETALPGEIGRPETCGRWVAFTRDVVATADIIGLKQQGTMAQLPIYVFFFSSFALTAMVYFFAIIFISGGLFYKVVAILTGRRLLDLEKNLCTVLSIPLACLAGMLTMWWN